MSRLHQDYKVYIKKSKKWKEKRDEYYNSDLPWQCGICEKKRKLDLHHRTYKTLGNEHIKTDLIPLCRNHHHAVHFRWYFFKVPLEYKYLYQRELLLKRYYNQIKNNPFAQILIHFI